MENDIVRMDERGADRIASMSGDVGPHPCALTSVSLCTMTLHAWTNPGRVAI